MLKKFEFQINLPLHADDDVECDGFIGTEHRLEEAIAEIIVIRYIFSQVLLFTRSVTK